MNSGRTGNGRPELAKISAIIFILLACIAAGSVSAQEIADLEALQDEAYVYSEIETALSFTGGYRFIHKSGEINIVEFEYLHDSIVLGGELRKFKFPHRLFIEFDFNNRKDYHGELRYSYKDLVYIRGIGRALFHNLDNIILQSGFEPPLPFPFAPAFERLDTGEEYGIKTGIYDVFFRFKTPDFPAHLYIHANQTDRNGNQQQRSLLGSGWYNSPVRTSQKRSIDWKADDIIVGANSHLGPIEIDFSHSEKRFDVDGNRTLFHTYSDSGFDPFNNLIVPGSVVRLSGTFPHNLIPELKGSSTTLKLHTSYTGSLVASATFTKIDRENITSGAKADYFMGSGELQWMPMHKLAFFLKYSHRETDIDNPVAIPINYLGYPSYNAEAVAAVLVKPSVSSISDKVTGTARYRPFSGLTIKADYTYENIKRQDNERWQLPDSTAKHIFSLSADTKILKNLNLKARYTRKEMDDPAYNSDLDSYDEGRLSITWLPHSKIITLLNYTLSKGKRDDLLFEESDEAQNRDVKSNRLIGSITFLVIDNVALTTSYAYMSNKIEHDIILLAAIPQIDRNVPYKNTSNNYAVDINYTPKKHLSLNAGISHTVSKANFTPNIDPEITSFSAIKTKDTVYSASGEYKFKNDFSLSLSYKHIDFNDAYDNKYDEWKDGTAHITMLTISKRW